MNILKILIVLLGLFCFLTVVKNLSDCTAALDFDGGSFSTEELCYNVGGVWIGGTPACAQGDATTCAAAGFTGSLTCTAVTSNDAPCTEPTSCSGSSGNYLLLASGEAAPSAEIAANGSADTASATTGKARCVSLTWCKDFGYIDSGSNTCVAPTDTTYAGCLKLGLDFKTDQCVDAGTVTSGDKYFTKLNCLKAGLNYVSTGCTSTAQSDATNNFSKLTCLQNGLNYASTGCTSTSQSDADNNFSEQSCLKLGYTHATAGCTTTAIAYTDCYENFLVYNTDGKCYSLSDAPSSNTYKPTKQDCALYGYDLKSSVCAEYSSKSACPVAVSDDTTNNFFIYDTSAKTCKPVAAQQNQVCYSYGLTPASPCTIPTSCPEGWELETSTYNANYCKPKTTEGKLPCLNLQLALDGTECVVAENDKCSLLHSKLKANSNKTECVFSSSSYASDEKIAVCISIGQSWVSGDSCTYQTCATPFTKPSGYSNICFPTEEIDCLNNVMSYTNTSTLCVDVIDSQSDCTSAGLTATMGTAGTTEWCVTGDNTFSRCNLPSANTCPSSKPYYDYTVTDNYKCLATCSSAGVFTVDKLCYSACPTGYHNGGQSSGVCSACTTGCTACTYHTTYGEDCSACTSKYVLNEDSNSIGSCYTCGVSNCLACAYATYSTKCTTCPTTGYVKESTDSKDYCHECILNCDSCSSEDDAYETYCNSCSSSTHSEKDDDEKIIKCTCDTKYQNTQWRDQIFARNDYDGKDPYIGEIDTQTAFATFYCKLYAYFLSSIPSNCDSSVDTLLYASEDADILLKLLTRLNELFEVSGSGFDDTPNLAADYLEHFLKLDLASGNVNDDIISKAFQIMNNDLFDESPSTIVGLMNDYLENVSTDSQFTKFQGSIDALTAKMNEKLLNQTSTSTSLSSDNAVKFYQNKITAVPSTSLLGIQFSTETTNFMTIDADTEVVVIAKLQTSKRTYDAADDTDTKVKSGTQIDYSFAKKTTTTVADVATVSLTAIEVETTEGCIDVNFEMTEVLTLSDSSANAVYVGQWQTDSSTWAISSVTQANTQENVQNLNACVSSFKTPFIAMEYTKQVSSTEFGSILSMTCLFFILSIFFY